MTQTTIVSEPQVQTKLSDWILYWDLSFKAQLTSDWVFCMIRIGFQCLYNAVLLFADPRVDGDLNDFSKVSDLASLVVDLRI